MGIGRDNDSASALKGSEKGCGDVYVTGTSVIKKVNFAKHCTRNVHKVAFRGLAK